MNASHKPALGGQAHGLVTLLEKKLKFSSTKLEMNRMFYLMNTVFGAHLKTGGRNHESQGRS